MLDSLLSLLLRPSPALSTAASFLYLSLWRYRRDTPRGVVAVVSWATLSRDLHRGTPALRGDLADLDRAGMVKAVHTLQPLRAGEVLAVLSVRSEETQERLGLDCTPEELLQVAHFYATADLQVDHFYATGDPSRLQVDHFYAAPTVSGDVGTDPTSLVDPQACAPARGKAPMAPRQLLNGRADALPLPSLGGDSSEAHPPYGGMGSPRNLSDPRARVRTRRAGALWVQAEAAIASSDASEGENSDLSGSEDDGTYRPLTSPPPFRRPPPPPATGMPVPAPTTPPSALEEPGTASHPSAVGAGSPRAPRATERMEAVQAAIRQRDRAVQSAANLKGKVYAPKAAATLTTLRTEWESAQRLWDPDGIPEGWGPAERAKITALVEMYGAEVVGAAVRFFVGQWPRLRPRIFSGRESVPTVRVLHQLHGTVVPQAAKVEKAQAVVAEYEAWSATHGDSMVPSEDLAERVHRAQAVIRDALGADR